jgi:hypothetical protein
MSQHEHGIAGIAAFLRAFFTLHRQSRFVFAIQVATCLVFLGTAASAQVLTNWTEEGKRITPGEDPTAVLLPDGRVRVYYSDNQANVVSAISSDGLNFTQEAGIRLPAMPYSGSIAGISAARVVPLSNGQWRMFFASNPALGITDAGPGIGSAISSDGLNFTIEPHWRVPFSAVNAGPGGQLGDGGTVVALPNGTYRIYFTVDYPTKVGVATLSNGAVMSATSTNMKNWTVDPGVRVGNGSALGGSAVHPDAIVNGDGSVTLFYEDDSLVINGSAATGIKYATSSDSLNFPTETLTSLNSGNPGCLACFYADPAVYPLAGGGLRLYFDTFSATTQTSTLWSAISVEPAPGTAALVAAVLPSSRSVQVGATATAFATIINAGLGQGLSCGIAPVTSVPVTFSYQMTDPATNALTGSANMPAQIAANASQSFVIALTPTGPFQPTDVQLSLVCSNSAPAPIISGLDTLLLSGSTTPVPDIVALAASGDPGIVDIPGNTGSGAFAVATANVGAGASITVTADTGSATLPVSIALCQTNPITGACINPTTPGTSAAVTINAGATPTFGIFVTGTGAVSFAPGTNRVFVRFKDSGGSTRGSTSVAVRTQ